MTVSRKKGSTRRHKDTKFRISAHFAPLRLSSYAAKDGGAE